VLLVLRPDTNAFNMYATLPLLAAILFALAMILTRTKCQSEHPLMLSLALNISFLLIGGLATVFISVMSDESRQGFLLAPWAAMGTQEWISIALLSVAILIGSIGAAIAYQQAPSSIVGVFDYTYVGFAVLWGLLFFGEVPDVISVIGMAMIVLAGVVSLRG